MVYVVVIIAAHQILDFLLLGPGDCLATLWLGGTRVLTNGLGEVTGHLNANRDP